MSFSIAELAVSVASKMRQLEPYGGSKQVTVTKQQNGTVGVFDGANGQLIVGFTADEWKFLIDSRQVPVGNQNRD